MTQKPRERKRQDFQKHKGVGPMRQIVSNERYVKKNSIKNFFF